MKTPIVKANKSGRVMALRQHMQLADMFGKLARMHARAGRMMANGPDAAVAGLPKPDRVVGDIRGGKALIRQAVIGGNV